MICFSTGPHTYGMIDSYVQKVKVKASMASYIHITMWFLLWLYFLSMVPSEVKKLPPFHGSCLVHDLWWKSKKLLPFRVLGSCLPWLFCIGSLRSKAAPLSHSFRNRCGMYVFIGSIECSLGYGYHFPTRNESTTGTGSLMLVTELIWGIWPTHTDYTTS